VHDRIIHPDLFLFPRRPTTVAKFARTLTAHCSIRETEVKLNRPTAEILKDLKSEVEKRLSKKGISVEWIDATQTPELALRLVRIDEGNQLLRYLLPFLAPAVVAIEGQVSVDSQEPREFQSTRRAHFGLFGGTAKAMLHVCNVQVAKDITKAVTKALRTVATA
jgi:hypothetical protein